MSKSIEKEKAIILRRSGESVKDISKKLGVSKSTASVWCRSIILDNVQKDFLYKKMVKAGHKGRLMGAEKNHNNKVEVMRSDYSFAENKLNNISSRDMLIAGICLYWSEGSKKDAGLIFTNSDPDLIIFMKKWYKEVFGINDFELMPRIFINQIHRKRIDKVLCFWSKLLMLPKKQFGNPTFLNVHNKKTYENFDDYYGVMALRVRNPVRFKYKVMGLIEAFRKQIHMSE